MMITSPILQSEDMGGAGASMAGGAGMMIDPNMDPELAMALRLSMED
jgi:26S proteasome regulatory subunit N10